MPEEKSAPDQNPLDQLFGLMFGWLATRAIHVAAELGIADLLHDGPKQSISSPARPGPIGSRFIGSCGCWPAPEYLPRIALTALN